MPILLFETPVRMVHVGLRGPRTMLVELAYAQEGKVEE